MTVDIGHLRVGDKVRVVGEFVIQEINDTSFGTQLVHVDANGQYWSFVPGSSTTSVVAL